MHNLIFYFRFISQSVQYMLYISWKIHITKSNIDSEEGVGFMVLETSHNMTWVDQSYH